MNETINVNGVDYVKKAPAKQKFTMGTEIFCNMCGKKLAFMNGWSSCVRPLQDGAVYELQVCKPCHTDKYATMVA